MVLLHFRLSAPKEELEKVTLWLRGEAQVKISVFEISKEDKDHSHTIMEVKNKSTFIQHFHKQFKKKYVGNKSYCAAELRETIEKNYQYCCKGISKDDGPFILYSSLPIGDIEKYHEAYWKLNEECVKNNKTVEEATKSTFMDRVIKDISSMDKAGVVYLHNVYKPTDSETTRKDELDYKIYCLMLKHFGKLSKILDENIERRMFKGIINKIMMEEEPENIQVYMKRKFLRLEG